MICTSVQSHGARGPTINRPSILRDHPINIFQRRPKRPCLVPEYLHARRTQAPSSSSVVTASHEHIHEQCIKSETRRKTHLHTLRRSSLQQVIQARDHDHAFQAAVYLYPANDPPVLALYVSERRHALLGAHEALAGVERRVACGDVARAELGRGKRERKRAEDPTEERGDARDEGEVHAWLGGDAGGRRGEELGEVVSRLAFVDVVRERVGADTAAEAFGRHFWEGYRASSRFAGLSDCPGTAVP